MKSLTVERIEAPSLRNTEKSYNPPGTTGDVAFN
jgi:hypothetical protein